MEINNFSFPVEILKSGEERNGRIPITIIPSSSNIDRVSDKMITKAFTKKCMDSFLYDGVLDYDHISVLGKTPLSRAEAIIGEPQKMFIKNQVPVVEGFLFKNNPYVKNCVLPALEAESNRIAASLGGKIIKKSSAIDPVSKKKVNTISEIKLNHIALTPLSRAVNQDTSVELRKSFNGNEETEIIFDKYDTFIKSFTDPEVLQKALQAGSATNIAGLSGGQAVQMQSLEGGKQKVDNKKIKNILPFVLEGILNKTIGGTTTDYIDYLLKKGLNSKEAMKLITLIATKGSSIVKLTF